MREDRRKANVRWLDVPVLALLPINVEVLLYGLLIVVAAVACLSDLGSRTLSHDECVHAIYSRDLYAGRGFQHEPWRHGPFLYHVNALIYTLFGVSDTTARVSTALFGVSLVIWPAFLRRELGRVGALAASTMMLLSPSMLYYARYLRNDIYMVVWAMWMTIALFRYLRSQRVHWLYLGAFAVSMALCSKENALMTGFVGCTFLALLALVQRLSPTALRKATAVAAVLLVVLGMALASTSGGAGDGQGEGTALLRELLVLSLGVLAALILNTLLAPRSAALQPGVRALVEYALSIGALVAWCVACGAVVWLALAQLPAGVLSPPLFVALQVVAATAGAMAGAWSWRALLARAVQRGWLSPLWQRGKAITALAVAAVPFVLLYTTFLTHPQGLATGTVGALSYWLAQQGVKRGSQPWWYYVMLTSLYDFLPLALSVSGMLYYTWRGARGRGRDAQRGAFVAYCVYWLQLAWLLYSWAGERMPWMVVHITQPAILLSGCLIDDLVAGLDWRSIWRRAGIVLALLAPWMLAVLALTARLPLIAGIAPARTTIAQGAAALVAGAIGMGAIGWLWRRIGGPAATRVVLLSCAVVGGVLTARYAVMAVFVNGDTAKEFLVYSHGAPGAKQTVDEIREISRRLYGDEAAIPLAYGGEGWCPLEWYFSRHFPNRTFFGDAPTRAIADAPVVVAGYDVVPEVEPLLRGRYHRYDRRYLWFPHQDYYMNVSLGLPPEEARDPRVSYLFHDMRDPELRRALWNVLLYRRYEQTLAEWEPGYPGPFVFYVRKDVAAQLWDRVDARDG